MFGTFIKNWRAAKAHKKHTSARSSFLLPDAEFIIIDLLLFRGISTLPFCFVSSSALPPPSPTAIWYDLGVCSRKLYERVSVFHKSRVACAHHGHLLIRKLHVVGNNGLISLVYIVASFPPQIPPRTTAHIIYFNIISAAFRAITGNNGRPCLEMMTGHYFDAYQRLKKSEIIVSNLFIIPIHPIEPGRVVYDWILSDARLFFPLWWFFYFCVLCALSAEWGVFYSSCDEWPAGSNSKKFWEKS